jgi:rubrerythrin
MQFAIQRVLSLRVHALTGGRRRWLVQALALGAGLWWALTRNVQAGQYPVTAAAMREAHDAEMAVYYRYIEFGRCAQREGYRGVAYLFTAFASAELIHAKNFGRVLSRLGSDVEPVAKPQVDAGRTRDNLIAAAEVEATSVDEYYPELLERIRAEGHRDAMEAVRWAWATEKQHREDIRQIQRWSPTFFEQVAKRIDDKTGQYYVCQACGNTVHKVPARSCPVCNGGSSHFKLIEPPL